MDLTKMNRDDLKALQGKLRVIGNASDALAEGGFEPLICLTGDASVITVEPILSMGPVAEVVLFEAVTDFPVILHPSETVEDAAHNALVDALETRVGLPEACATVEALQVKQQSSELDLVSGPVTEAEKRQIEDMFLKGASNAEISASLRRHPSIIGSHIYYFKKRQVEAAPVKSSVASAQPTEARKAVVALAGQAADQRATTSKIQKPGGDQGGLQQLHPAEHDPVQSGAVSGQSPATAPEQAAENLPMIRSPIWDHVKALGFPKGWDAELDLEMVEAFARGVKVDQLALDLDVDSKLIKDRYAALTACIRNDRGHMQIDGQEKLVRILRERVKILRAGAKAA
ncbi:hypothetical protein GCM10010873_26790 [Cypionkella aquatica]|uniref:Uncharacterized protein n=1 Tax=Cypionkella aquatica TaxID=1756042 RepID=A0AA37TY52_9RHOB|nr:hypothetical protein [Cypionkella aquatica]GLS87705.1 hypothetical protein GCM10010873_26790 [Cypionkella aquatica]